MLRRTALAASLAAMLVIPAGVAAETPEATETVGDPAAVLDSAALVLLRNAYEGTFPPVYRNATPDPVRVELKMLPVTQPYFTIVVDPANNRLKVSSDPDSFNWIVVDGKEYRDEPGDGLFVVTDDAVPDGYVRSEIDGDTRLLRSS